MIAQLKPSVYLGIVSRRVGMDCRVGRIAELHSAGSARMGVSHKVYSYLKPLIFSELVALGERGVSPE